MWLLQKNLPAIVVVVVYAKQIMALGRKKTVHSSHSFHPLIINAKGDGLETPWPLIFFSLLPFMQCVCPSLSSSVHLFLQVCMFKVFYYVFPWPSKVILP